MESVLREGGADFITSSGSFFKMGDHYSPLLDIHSKYAFPTGSPHALATSSSSSSSSRSSPPGTHEEESVVKSEIHHDLGSSGSRASESVESPVSSLRSEDPEDVVMSTMTELPQPRTKSRKQSKPVRLYENDGENAADEISSQYQTLPGPYHQRPDDEDEGLPESFSGSSPGSTSPREAGQLPPMEASTTSNRVFPTGPSGARIFNPDAYCELCDREFCNKYFLKTHKANKHQVYDPNSSSPPRASSPVSVSVPVVQEPAKPQAPPMMPMPPQLPMNPFGMNMNYAAMAAIMNMQNDLHRSKGEDEKRNVAQQLMALYAQNWAMHQMLQSGGAPPMFPLLQVPGNPMMGLFPSPGSPQLQLPTRGPPMEASPRPQGPKEDAVFCELCSKRLSSKNFLRLHMRRKHGIVEAREEAPASMLIPEMAQIKLEAKMSKRKMKRLAKMQLQVERERNGLGMDLVVKNEDVPRPVISKDLEGFQQKIRTTDVDDPFQGRADGQQQNYSNLQRLLQTFHTSKNGTRETFRCRECYKDFTSGFYLEQHHAKEHSHGSSGFGEPGALDLSTTRSSRAPPALQRPESTRERTRSTPVEPQERFAPSNPRTPCGEVSSQSSPTPGAAGIDLESFCIKCNREYCSKYFLRTHLLKFHGISTEQYLEEVRVLHPEVWQQFVSNPAAEAPPLGTPAAPQLTSRRNWCKHCKKDFCNKYFFKTHMFKMHSEVIADHTPSGRTSKKRSTGVLCEICNKELCSKYFLKIHKRNAHGIQDPTLGNGQTSPSFATSMGGMSFAGSLSDDGEEMRMESGDEDEDQPISMVVPRASVIICTGTHFIPPPEEPLTDSHCSVSSPVSPVQGCSEEGDDDDYDMDEEGDVPLNYKNSFGVPQ